MNEGKDRLEAEARQQAVVEHPGECYVEACPGAGKTQTLVQRVIQRSRVLPPRCGIAVLSFTNSAVDELKERYSTETRSLSLAYPNFVGTFDAFLNHFIVLPFGVPGCNDRPTIVDSWEDIDVRHGQAGVKAPPIPLRHFDPITGSLNQNRLKRLSADQLAQLANYETMAQRSLHGLRKKGMLSSSSARQVVVEFLNDNGRANALGAALVARFPEVIVDEAQDCNDDDVRILQWLRSNGAKLTLVCDPDQAIYGFRKGSARSFASFVRQLPSLPLTGNFRSSRIICATAATMRTRNTMDVAVGEHRSFASEVQVVTYKNTVESKAAVAASFRALAQGANIDLGDLIVLAHKRSLAERISANVPQPAGSGSRIGRLIDATIGYSSVGATARQKGSAVRATIRVLMEIEKYQDADVSSLRPLTHDQRLSREFHRKSIQLLDRLVSTYTRQVAADEWLAVAREEILKHTGSTTARVALPANQGWEQKLLKMTPAAALPYATVHEAKGRAFDAVCLAIDNDEDVLSDWKNRASSTSEALRVLYVGLTRARKLAVLAVHQDHEAALRQLIHT
jgi:DNA helicase-2/ATP-dependent DNA helicase PcrA